MASSEKIAIVTGAGTGIGKAVALALLREGYSVVLAGRRKELLEATAREGTSSGSRALVVPTDVSNPASVSALFARAKAEFGRLDLLFNNARNGVPQAPGAVAVEPTMDVQHVAGAVVYMASLPLDANVQFLTVMATKIPFVGRG